MTLLLFSDAATDFPVLHLLRMVFFAVSLEGCGRCVGLLYEGRLGCLTPGKPLFSSNESHAKVLLCVNKHV